MDLNYNFKCDWLIELFNDKLSDNNLASKFVEIGVFKPIAIEKIVILMVMILLLELMVHVSFV